MAGGGAVRDRRPDDFYPTPPECTVALLSVWDPGFSVWEPMVGDGAIADVLCNTETRDGEHAGHVVMATDIVDRGYPMQVADFFTFRRVPMFGELRSSIVTNPPFFLAHQIIEHAFDIGVTRMALLLKSTFWHAQRRHNLFVRHRPRWIFPLLWRPDFTGQGGATMDCSWVVWDGEAEVTEYQPLERPNPAAVAQTQLFESEGGA